ncbi:MAG: hypothetical protein CMJ35_15225 [Phycisphaerae bacterium]|nr:hypothetical protein [Phycisphaerae bacterium]MBM92941.1 hypothetical protein [Phycisphaerae bacterium]
MIKTPAHPDILQAVARTGAILAQEGYNGPVRLVIAGGVAGLLSGLTRATLDCDVLSCSDDDQWERIENAAREAAAELDLPETWLNRECSIYANDFPLGWQDRTEPVDRFGPLDVHRVSRKDWIAAKLVSSLKRPQDIADIRELKPTAEELSFAEEHLDRLTAEHLDGHDYASQRAILQSIRSQP